MKRNLIYILDVNSENIEQNCYNFLSKVYQFVNEISIIIRTDIINVNTSKLSVYSSDIQKISSNLSYKSAIELAKKTFKNDYDSVLLADNSFIGPVYTIDCLFDVMDKKNVDVWGVTSFPVSNDSKKVCLDSYFISISKKVFDSDLFAQFISNKNKKIPSTIEKFMFSKEITEFLSNNNFAFSSFIPNKNFDSYKDDLYLFPYHLVAIEKCPFIKKDFFVKPYEFFNSYNRGNEAHKLLKFLNNESISKYFDQNLIWSSILKSYPLSYLRNNLQLSIIESSKYTSDNNLEIVKKAKLVTLLYIYYPESIDFCLSYLSYVKEFSNICVVSARDDTLSLIKEKLLSNQYDVSKLEFRLKTNKGRDLSSYLIDCKDLFDKYDYMLYFHDKLSPHLSSFNQTLDFSEHCLHSILKSKEHFANLFSSFAEQPFLGMIVPPPLNYGQASLSEFTLHPNNELLIKDLIQKLDLNVPFDKYPVAPYGDFFICRTKAMKKLFNINWTYEMLPDEPIASDGTLLHALERIIPFVIQSAGYYVSWGFCEDSIRIHDANCHYYTSEYNKHLMSIRKEFSFKNLLNIVDNEICQSKSKLNSVEFSFKDLRKFYYKKILYKVLNKLTFSLFNKDISKFNDKFELLSNFNSNKKSFVYSLSGLHSSHVYSEILKDMVFEQNIYIFAEKVNMIGILLATYNRVNTSDLYFKLKDFKHNEIFRKTIDASSLSDNSWLYIDIDNEINILINNSPSHKFFIEVSSNAEAGNGVTWLSDPDNLGEANINGNIVPSSFTWKIL